jgi:hypothetical protein
MENAMIVNARVARAAGILVLCLAAGQAGAAAVARADVDAWLATPAPTPPPAPGSVLGQGDLEGIRALIPPGYFDYVNYPGVQIEIQATGDYKPHPVYQAATEQHGNEATLRPEGGMAGYVAGRPFDPQKFDDVSPQDAGMMVAWNYVHRWQYYGYKVDALDMTYVQATADGRPGTLEPGMEGGGNADRRLVQVYQRVYLNHLAMLPDKGYKVAASNSDKRYFKDYISFVEPFDVQGTTFVVERSLDPLEGDQVNSYLPTQRRVRRLSAEERADSFMGSNFTLDDFEGFSGRVMDYEWTYLGQKEVLHVSDSKEKQLRFGGPQSNVAIDRWQVRPCFVVELKPRWSGHPMSAKILLVDQQTFNPAMALIFNREGQLWRFVMPHYQQPVHDESTPERSLETSVAGWRGSIGLDFLTNSTTLARATTETLFPTLTEREIERRFALSTLTEGR